MQPEDWPSSPAFSHGWEVSPASRIAFLSGQTGTARATGDVVPSIEAQTARAFANIKQLLATRGLGLTDIVRTTVYLVRAADVEGFRAARAAVLRDHRPASTLLFVNALSDPRHLVEIDVIAASTTQTRSEDVL